MTARHVWEDAQFLVPVKCCRRCPDIWWIWHNPEEPSTPCVPIEDVTFDYATTQGEVA